MGDYVAPMQNFIRIRLYPFAPQICENAHQVIRLVFLPRCLECRRGLVMRKLFPDLSVKHVHCDKTEEKSVRIFIPYERSFSLVF